MVKNFGDKKVWQIWRIAANSSKFFANIHDEAHDHTICVTELTHKLNTSLNNYVATRYLMK